MVQITSPLTPEQIRQAQEFAQRVVIQGKPVDARLKSFKSSFDRLKSTDARFRRDVQSGLGTRIESKRLGFRSVEEFQSLQKREKKAIRKTIRAKPLSERLALQRKAVAQRFKEIKRIRELTPEQRQKFFIEQAQFRKASRFQEIQDRGGKLTTESRRFLTKAKLRFQSQSEARQKDLERKIDITARKIERESKKEIPKDNKLKEKIIELGKKIESKLPKILAGGELKKERQNLNTQIEEFNKIFGNKSLSESEFKKAQRLSSNIGNKISELEKKEEESIGKELPFEKATKILPTIAKIVGTTIAKVVVPPFRGSPEEERKKFRKNLIEGFGVSAEAAVSLGQFAIPFIGQALFLGSLLEKPILDNKSFKAEFKENPKQTALLYGLGLVGVKGGVKNALTKKEIKKLNNEFKKAKIDFIAEADKKTLKVLARTKVRGINIITTSDIALTSKKLPKGVVAGKQISIKKVKKKKIPKKEEIELLLTKVGIKGKVLKKALVKAVRETKREPRFKLSKKLKTVAFEAEGINVNIARLLFKKKKLTKKEENLIKILKKRLKEKELLPVKISEVKKENIAGVISPTEVENLFKILAGDKRLRIYKRGDIKLVFDPRIRGFLKIKPTIKDKIAGKKRLQKQINEAISLPKLKIITKPLKEVKFKKITELKKTTQKAKLKKKPLIKEKEIALASLASITAKTEIKKKFTKILKKKTLKVKQRKRLIKRVSTLSSQIKKLKTKAIQEKKLKSIKRLKIKQQRAFKEKLKLKPKLKLKKAIKEAKKVKKILIPKIRPPIKPPVKLPIIIKKKKKPIKKKKPERKKPAFNVFARPLKKKGQKTKPKLIKVNKVPLSKRNAKRLGSTIADQTLARTFNIRPSKGKPQKPKLKTKPFRKVKFRGFKIVKGKKVPLKNTFIERSSKGRNFLIDTRGEKSGLKLREGISRLEKKSGIKKRVVRKVIKRPKVRVRSKSVQRITARPKRQVTSAQLSALAKGRKQRLINLKKKK